MNHIQVHIESKEQIEDFLNLGYEHGFTCSPSRRIIDGGIKKIFVVLDDKTMWILKDSIYADGRPMYPVYEYPEQESDLINLFPDE